MDLHKMNILQHGCCDSVNYDTHTDALVISWIWNKPEFFRGLTSDIKKKFLESETFFIVFDYVNILWVLECTYIYHEQ